MDKFWGGALLILLTTVGLTLQTTTSPTQIQIRDLETECVEQKITENNLRVNYDKSLTFQGQYPVLSPESELNVDYQEDSNEITLNVETTKDIPPNTNYTEDCDAYAVYHVQTDRMEGRKTIEIQNNGQTMKRQTINIR